MSSVKEWIKAGATIIDVRSPEEFRMGANPKSVNMPIDRFPQQMGSLDKSKFYVMCCASGGRSGMATSMMKGAGFKNIVNAGPWQNTL